MSHSKIIAVDFDGCLVTNKFPNIGEPIWETINALKAEQESGAQVILWTCRRDDQLDAAVEWCSMHGIYFDEINRNLPAIVKSFGGDTVKVFAHEYWDDRARVMPSPVDEKPRHDLSVIANERDTLMKRYRAQVEVIRTRIDNGGLLPSEKQLLDDLKIPTDFDKRPVPIKPEANNPKGYWYCPFCKEELIWQRVTFEECCAGCGHPVDWVELSQKTKLYEITNGYEGASYIRVYCITESEENAVNMARGKLRIEAEKISRSGDRNYPDDYYEDLTITLLCDDITGGFCSEIMN